MTVFVPISVADAQALRMAGEARELLGYADGPGLRRWLADSGLGGVGLDDEEADYVVLNHAGIAALQLDGATRRLVLAVDLELRSEDPLGSVAVPQLRWAEVRSLFADDPAAAPALAAARHSVVGLSLAEALVRTEVEALQNGHDLLWYAPEELDTLTDPA